jgi:predicted nucleotide-binding protein
MVALTALGQRVVAPTEQGDDMAAKREALLRPRVIREFLQRYDRKKLPPNDIARNVLASLGVDKAATERTFGVILDGAAAVGVIRNLKGGDWVDLQGASRTDIESEPEQNDDREDLAAGAVPVGALAAGRRLNKEDDEASASRKEVAKPKPIFIGHGKRRGPLEKLEKLLASFDVPYKVAVEEANLGRPIPKKVRELIDECGSAILIFTRDEQFFDKDRNETWRPSENVVYELGATSYLYDDRVVVLMEKGLKFPSNFDSIGRIEFEEDSIEAKTLDIMRELIGLGLLKITPA